jgi:2'-hydroxyisoflavone reductase
MAEVKATGTYNAVGPASPLTFGQVLTTCIGVSGAAARPVWVEEAFLLEHGVAPWVELPLWVPQQEASLRGLLDVDAGKALGAGLSFRPLAETVRDTLEWDKGRAAVTLQAGLSSEREQEMLAVWHGAPRA